MSSVSIPKGFIINLFKYLDTSIDDHEKMEDFYNSKSGDFCRIFGKREITYGHYDRMQFLPVRYFSDYTEKPSQAYNWLGTSQSTLIFPLSKNENDRSFGWEGSPEKPSIRVRSGQKKFVRSRGFLAASFCYISDEARNRFAQYDELLDYCQSTIQELVTEYNKIKERLDGPDNTIIVEVFGSFSSAEIVILWSSKQYVDILYLVDNIKDIRAVNQDKPDESVNIFRSTYTTISYPDNLSEYNERQTEELFRDAKHIRGDALIGIGIQENTEEGYVDKAETHFRNALKYVSEMFGEEEDPPCDMFICAGEYDLIFKTKSKYVSRIFHKLHAQDENNDGRDMNIHNSIFHRFFLHTSTRLCYSLQDDLPEFVRGIEWENKKKGICSKPVIFSPDYFDRNWRSNLIQKLWEKNRRSFDALQVKIRTCFPAVSSFSVVLDQLFSDYVQCSSTAADYIWIMDYNEFIEKVLEILHFYLDEHFMKGKGTRFPFSEDSTLTRRRDTCGEMGVISVSASSFEILQEMTRLVESVEQQTIHISASNKLFFKEQNAHFGYTAQYDLLIHAFYGMIKELMEEIYRHETNPGIQSSLYPLINFRPVHSIESEMFVESYKPSKCNHERIIVFKLPLDAMNNILHYTPMLIHEVYHYAAPAHRKGRNEYLSLIATHSLLTASVCRLFYYLSSEVVGDWISGMPPVMESAVESGASSARLAMESTDYPDPDALCSSLNELFDEKVQVAFKEILDQNRVAVLNDISRYQVKQNGDEILRSWHQVSLRNWLFHPKEDVADKRKDGKEERCSFEQLIEYAVLKARDILEEILKGKSPSKMSAEEQELFSKTAQSFLSKAGGNGSVPDSFLQNVLEEADRTYDDELDDIFCQLDELMPDCAMVAHSGMSISGYLLQVAINHDANFYEINTLLPTDALRYGLIMDWIMAESCKGLNGGSGSKLDTGTNSGTVSETGTRRESGECTGEKIPSNDLLSAELDKFKVRYCAVYQIQDHAKKYDDSVVMEKAERWSEYFFSCYENHYKRRFCVIRPWLFELLNKHIIPILYAPSEKFRDTYRGYLQVLDSKVDDRQDQLFSHNLRTIHLFQNQRLIKVINSRNIKPVDTPTGNLRVLDFIDESDYTYRVSDYTKMHYAFDWILNKMQEYRRIDHSTDHTGMWFRGVGNAKFSILPSGLVHFAENCEYFHGKCRIDDDTYIACQRHLYENFRYTADSSPEHQNPAFYTQVDHLALMQHYQTHSNLLDWSEDIDTALYFALESEITVNEKFCKDRKDKANYDYPDDDGVVLILDPVRFNKACRELEKELDFLQPLELDNPDRYELIPNLSVVDTQKYYREYSDIYLEADRNWIRSEQTAEKWSFEYLDQSTYNTERNTIHARLPRAVYTSKINPRLKAQSGMFVAFSLLSRPMYPDGKDKIHPNHRIKLFEYESLDTLQNLYLRNNNTSPAIATNRNPFLYKIIIPKELKKIFGLRLHRLGFSKEKFYPEIQNHHSR